MHENSKFRTGFGCFQLPQRHGFSQLRQVHVWEARLPLERLHYSTQTCFCCLRTSRRKMGNAEQTSISVCEGRLAGLALLFGPAPFSPSMRSSSVPCLSQQALWYLVLCQHVFGCKDPDGFPNARAGIQNPVAASSGRKRISASLALVNVWGKQHFSGEKPSTSASKCGAFPPLSDSQHAHDYQLTISLFFSLLLLFFCPSKKG